MFKYNGEKIAKYSTAKVFGGQIGYLGTFNKYANKKVTILYSPSFDEVLILNEKI